MDLLGTIIKECKSYPQTDLSRGKVLMNMSFENILIAKFKFLISEKGFSEPEIISDEKSYQKRILFKKNKLLIEMTNSYDMGFAIKLKTKNKKSDKGILIYNKSSENMDREFRYLDDGVNKVKSIIG